MTFHSVNKSKVNFPFSRCIFFIFAYILQGYMQFSERRKKSNANLIFPNAILICVQNRGVRTRKSAIYRHLPLNAHILLLMLTCLFTFSKRIEISWCAISNDNSSMLTIKILSIEWFLLFLLPIRDTAYA